MITIEKIKSDFSYIKAKFGDSEVYHSSPIFEGHGNLCDLYFKAKDEQVKQEQVDKYNQFRSKYKDYLPEIESYLLSTLKKSERKLQTQINESTLFIDVIEVPFDNFKYDLVLICGKTFKKYLFIKENIAIRVEFKDGVIKTIQRKKDVTNDNE